MIAWFGGIAVDLRDAEPAPDARLSVATVLGGIALRIPEGWKVESSVTAFAGGVDVSVPEPADPRCPGARRSTASRSSAESPSRRRRGRPWPSRRRARPPAVRAHASRAAHPLHRRRRRRRGARDGRARPSAARSPLPPVRGDGEEPPADHGRARGRRRAPARARRGEFEPSSGKLAVRKAAGNVVELGSILAFGFSPLWLLAGAADVTRGTRVYLDALVAELKAAGVIARRRGARLGRRAAGGARGGKRHVREAHRHPTARSAGSEAVPRGPALGCGEPAEPGRALGGLRRARPRGRAREAEPARGLPRHGARVLQLCAEGRPPARARPVHGGPQTSTRRGLRCVCPPRRQAVRRRGRPPLHPEREDARRTRGRAAGPLEAA